MVGGAWARLGEWSRSPRVVLGLALATLLLAVVFLAGALYRPSIELRVSAGDELGRRHQIAQVLARFARERDVHFTLMPTSGSADALARVESGELDVALVQGGLDVGRHVREVAPLDVEPLHLLVNDPSIQHIEDLRGHRVNLSTRGSGTRELALELLGPVGLRPRRDFTEVELSYDELESKPMEQMPEAIFIVSTLPSPVVEQLIRRRGYSLVPLPYARAMHLRDIGILEATIPAFTYSVSPPMPDADIPTLATRMIMVARQDAPSEAIKVLLEVLDTEAFEHAASLSPISHDALGQPEIALHDGALEWVHRNDPFLTPERIDNIESLRSFFVSVVVALFLAWRGFRARQYRGFEVYLHQVTALEREVLTLERGAELDLHRLLEIQNGLSDIKNRALEGYGVGNIGSGELLNGFLSHVSDVRSYLNRLILHERERLEKKARQDPRQEDRLRRALWLGAVEGRDSLPPPPDDEE
ncbi:MAG: TAXI family TRAP transporter solute-binding subunit [Sandaracinaceae bacterium]